MTSLDKRQNRWGALLLFVGTLLLFSATNLDGTWILDDRYQIERNPYLRSITHVPHILTTPLWMATGAESPGSGIYRPVHILSYAVDYHLTGLRPWFFHLDSNLLHALNVLLLFFLARRFLAFRTSLIVGALFAVHPIVTETATWIGGRMDLLVTLFALSCVQALASLTNGHDGPKWAAWVLYVLSIPFGIFSKEVFVPVPFATLAAIALFRGFRGINRNAWVAFGIAVIATVACLSWRSHVIGIPIASLFAPIATVNFPALLRRFFTLTLIPADTEFLFRYVPAHTSLAISALMTVATVLGTMAVAWWARRGAAVPLGLGLFLAPLVPISLVVDITGLLSERYFYLPLAGFLLFAGGMVEILSPWIRSHTGAWLKRMFPVAAGALICLLAVQTGARNRDWINEPRLYSSSIARDPANPLPNYFLAVMYHRLGDTSSEIANYETALSKDADHISSLNNLAVLFIERGKDAEARALLDRAFRIQPARPKTVFNYGYLYEKMGRSDEARRWYTRALELKPDYELARQALDRLETHR
ncbi:MAG: tetratricopeptide repeat protein [Pseudomonadota bacterium]